MPWIKALTGADKSGVRAQPFAALEAARPKVEIRNAAGDDGDEAEMLMYAPIGGWFGVWAEDVVDELKQISAPNIRVRVNSPGGSVFEGIAIANALRAHPAKVTVQVDSLAASIASVIAMAGDRVVMMPGSQIMVHDASAVTYGNAAEMRDLADLLDKQSDNIADQYAARAGGTRDDWRAVMRDETWYLADEAVEQGLADEVLTAPAPEEKPEEPSEPDMAAWARLFGFRYTGRDEAPAPAPVATQPEAPAAPASPTQIMLTLDGQTLTATPVAAAPTPPAAPEPAPEANPAVPALAADEPPEAAAAVPPTAPAPAAVPPPAPEPAEPPVDEWAAATAHLTEPPADDWSAAIAHLTTTTPAPCSAATEA